MASTDSTYEQDDGKTNPDISFGPVAHFLYAFFFALSIFMVLFSIATCFWYRAYQNMSSMTLIGLQVLMWTQTAIMWGLCFFDPPFFNKHLLTMMDLSNLLSGYICGIMNVVVFLQWAQVYKVISNPSQAT